MRGERTVPGRGMAKSSVVRPAQRRHPTADHDAAVAARIPALRIECRFQPILGNGQNLASAPSRYETIAFLPSLMKIFRLIIRVVGSRCSI